MIYVAPGTIAIVGLALLLLTWGEPRYSDPQWESPIILGADFSTEESTKLATQRFVDAQRKNLTLASHRADLGRVLLALGLSSALLLASLRIRSLRDARRVTTPGRHGLFVLANAAWLAFVPAQWLWLDYTSKRRDYPEWGDMIIIPAFSYLLTFLAILPVVNLGTHLCARRAILPCSLFKCGRSLRAFGAAGFLLLPAGFVLLLGIGAFQERDHFTVAVIPFALYAVLSLWAAAASPRAA